MDTPSPTDSSSIRDLFLPTDPQLEAARRVLEIGTLGGYSAIHLARALPPDGRLISLELDERHAQVARENLSQAGLADRADVRVGAALDLLPALSAVAP